MNLTKKGFILSGKLKIKLILSMIMLTRSTERILNPIHHTGFKDIQAILLQEFTIITKFLDKPRISSKGVGEGVGGRGSPKIIIMGKT